MNFGNHRYTNEQNCILFMCKCDIKNVRAYPPPKKKIQKTFLRP